MSHATAVTVPAAESVKDPPDATAVPVAQPAPAPAHCGAVALARTQIVALPADVRTSARGRARKVLLAALAVGAASCASVTDAVTPELRELDSQDRRLSAMGPGPAAV